MCCDELGIRSVLEPIKRHPRDFMNHGRLKVELEDSAGRPINTKFGKSKRKFFHAIGEIIHDQQVKFLEIVAQQEEAVAARMKAMQEA